MAFMMRSIYNFSIYKAMDLNFQGQKTFLSHPDQIFIPRGVLSIFKQMSSGTMAQSISYRLITLLTYVSFRCNVPLTI
jgi:hypothetical protein